MLGSSLRAVLAAGVAAIAVAAAGCLAGTSAQEKIPVPRPPAGRPLAGQTVLIIIPKLGFQDDELRVSREYLSSAGANVCIASSTNMIEALGMRKTKVLPDFRITNLNVLNFDAIVFIGGSGAVEFFFDPAAHRLAREAAEFDVVLGAICMATVTLARAGVLKERAASCDPSKKTTLERLGVRYSRRGVTADGNIVTASGPRQSGAFAEALLRALLRRKEREKEEAGR